MKAAVHERYGPPDVVRIADIAAPTPTDGELLVRVHATTVNRTDCGYRGGKPFVVRFFSGLPNPRVRVWGCEFAGTVEAVGAAVTAFAVGDRVFGYNERTFGGHGELLTVPADSLVATIPDSVSFEAAAAATEGAHYALTSIEHAKVGSDHRVMVYGATGAIGSAAVQLLKSRGAYVTAVCGTDHLDLVEGLGPDKVVDYMTQDFTADELNYDVVLDAVGKSTFAQCKPLLKPRGVYMSSELGPHGQNPMLALVTPLLGGKKVAFPIPKQPPEVALYLRDQLASGAFRPVLDPRRFALDEIVDAYRYAESGRKIGNIVIRLATD